MEKKPAAKKPAQTTEAPHKSPATKDGKAGTVAPKAGGRKKVDYDRIEAGWRAGLLSPRQLAAAYTEETGEAVSHAAIIKHFTSRDIPRDLSAKIHAKAEAMVTQAMVTGEVTPSTKIPEKRIVEEGAVLVTEIRLSQRRHIDRAMRLVDALFKELEQQTDPETLELLRDLGDFLRDENERGEDRRNDLYRRILSLPERSKTMKLLADTLKVLIDLQRTAYGMDKEPERKDDPLTTMLTRIASGSSGLKPVLHDPERSKSLTLSSQVQDDDDDD